MRVVYFLRWYCRDAVRFAIRSISCWLVRFEPITLMNRKKRLGNGRVLALCGFAVGRNKLSGSSGEDYTFLDYCVC